MDWIRIRTAVGLACIGLSLACALSLIREDARRRARDAERKREIQDWESEGGALATQPQVPGTPPRTTSATASTGV